MEEHIMKDFTRFSIQERLDAIEKRLEITKMIKDCVSKHPTEVGLVATHTVNNIFDSISSLLDDFNENIKMDLFELKVFLHHIEALPIQNEKGELE